MRRLSVLAEGDDDDGGEDEEPDQVGDGEDEGGDDAVWNISTSNSAGGTTCWSLTIAAHWPASIVKDEPRHPQTAEKFIWNDD